jgi:phosphopantetheinyl transferase
MANVPAVTSLRAVDLFAVFDCVAPCLPLGAACVATRTNIDPRDDAGAARLLGTVVHTRVCGYRSAERRRHFYAGRRTVAALADAMGLSGAQVAVDARGAPMIRHDQGTQDITITHSGDWALAAAAPGHLLGLDYEANLTGRTHLHRRVCGDDERVIHDLGTPETGERIRAFGHIWTAKEALFKAWRVGLVVELRDLVVSPADQRGRLDLRAAQPLHPDIPHPLPASLYAAVVTWNDNPLALVGVPTKGPRAPDT